MLNMFSKQVFHRLLSTTNRARANTATQYPSLWLSQRYVSTHTIPPSITPHIFDRALLSCSPSKEPVSVAKVSEYVSRLQPFTVPAPPQQPMISPSKQIVETLELTSVLRKRRLKMNKHKHKKLRKRTRALRKKLGK
ncbi:MAG: hypothetical protein EXX96DRAFT_548762 [Benjaminiella poitrasii]|nr:MAG: hypothetical protein EXX96DRAFT_548762 [Benjaminiella poitrasii]